LAANSPASVPSEPDHLGAAGQPAASFFTQMLSKRQLECLAWVAAGKSSTDIGAILELSPDTIMAHEGR